MISVIIPVYNAEKYLRKAVESALLQAEVSEVLLVEDASPDNALAICRELEKEHPGRVRLLQHPDRKNHGAGASRNLGILNAANEYIAFLDADDYYLPGRFRNDVSLLAAQPDADGVYNALGTDVLEETERERARRHYGSAQLSTVYYPIPPEILFEEMNPLGNQGWFHLNCTTLRKRVFGQVGMFEPGLRLAQDTHLFLKLATRCRLVPGIIDRPVAMRGVHAENRIKDDVRFANTRPLLYALLLGWAQQNGVSAGRKQLIWKALYGAMLNSQVYTSLPQVQRLLKRLRFLLQSFRYDFLRTYKGYYEQLPLLRRIF